MNTESYRQRLLAKQRELAASLEQPGAATPDPGDQSVRDSGDESVQNEASEQQLRDAEADWMVLNQVRDALARIDNGTYGLCLAVSEPIDVKRLDAIPWASYCHRHQALLETSGPPRRTTL